MRNTRRHIIIASSVITALTLCGCGIKGELKTPPPLWGKKAKKVDTQKADKPKSQSNN